MLLEYESINRNVIYSSAVCASPAVVLSPLGFLDHVSKATCYPSPTFVDTLGKKYLKENVVVEGNIVTGNESRTYMYT